MDPPNTAIPSSRKTDDAESARREANRALDDIAKRLGLSPRQLRRMIEQGRTREILALANQGLPPELCDPSAGIATGPEPWPEPVRGSDVLARMTNAIAFHVHMDPYLALTAALWAMHTHDPERFERTPRLVIHSGRVTSGKTTLLSVLACLVCRPLKICAAKSDSLIDALADRPTLLIDDAAALLQGNRDARTVIRNGCCRSGAQLLRKTRMRRPQAIDLFTPMAVAIDGDIPPMFAGRSIGIPLEPMRFGQSAGPLSPEALDNLSGMGRMAARWAADTEDDPPPDAATLAHGDDPNWQPLIAIAAAIGDEWLGRTIEAMRRARDVSATSELERLLRDIRKIIPSTGPDVSPSPVPTGNRSAITIVSAAST